jgi:predicted N-formylglutamate amidohydrolase
VKVAQESTTAIGDRPTLLTPAETSEVVEILNLGGKAPIVLVSDHASNRVPAALNNLGVGLAILEEHIGWDIGARDVTCTLSTLMNAPAVLAGFSRLVVDLNRYPWDPSWIPQRADGIEIPGNEDVPWLERQRRLEELFIPYHAACRETLLNSISLHRSPLFLSVHSMTPQLNDGGTHRPWQIGVSWAGSNALSAPLIDELRARGVNAGDNQPYSLDVGVDFSTVEHAMRRGLPHLQIEFRQDLVGTHEGACRWADLLYQALNKVLQIMPEIRTQACPNISPPSQA